VVDTGTVSSMWHSAKIQSGEGVEHSSVRLGLEGRVMSVSSACVEPSSAVGGVMVGVRAWARSLARSRVWAWARAWVIVGGGFVPACAIIFLGNLAGGLGGLCQYLQLRWRVLAQAPTLNPRGAT